MAVKTTNLLVASKAKPKNTVSLPKPRMHFGSTATHLENRAPGAVPTVTPASSYQAVTPTVAKAPAAAPAQATPDLASDPIYQGVVAGIIAGRDNRITQLTKQKGVIKSSYGIEDTSDPFSKAALLQKSLTDSIRGTTTSRAARGMLYDSSTQHAQDINQTNYNESYDALVKAYNQSITDIDNEITNTTTDANSQINNAGTDAITRWVQTRPGPGDSGSGSGSGAASGKNPYTPGTPAWAKYAKDHGESWKTDSKGRWLIRRPSDGKFVLP